MLYTISRMPLSGQARTWINYLLPPGSPVFSSLPLATLREGADNIALLGGPPAKLTRVWERRIKGPVGPVRLRFYAPKTNSAASALVYFHGGGWTLGSLDSHDPVCRSLASLARCLVISVEYRLAPEHPFPAALEDCEAAARWVFRHAKSLGIRTSAIALGGDSAGGNLTAAVALQLRDSAHPPPAAQLLVSPVTGDPTRNCASYVQYGDGYFLRSVDMLWYWKNYCGRRKLLKNPRALPLTSADLSHLPPAIILTAECDPLRDDACRYAERLSQSGVPVFLEQYADAFHGFWNLAGVLPSGDRAIRDAARELRRIFRKKVIR